MKKESRLRLRSVAMSDIGARKNNEDAYLTDNDLGLFIVADGMGGHEKGEVASWFTSEQLRKIMDSSDIDCCEGTLRDDLDIDSCKASNVIEYAVMTINKRLYDLNEKMAAKVAHPPGSYEAEMAALKAKKKMGTTLVSLFVVGRNAYVVNIGDSRAYRIRNNKIERITQDHSWVEEQLRKGVLTPEEIERAGKKNVITRSVGFKNNVKADIAEVKLSSPERYLLCSDGLSNMVKEDELLEFGRDYEAREGCRRMIELAKDRGGRDNITAVLIEVSEREMAEVEDLDPTDLTF